ncbi:hypothetical protein AUK22_07250 [bacterium CG2_30_54_10]|nr:MAG: hypothetical protein AUK22_07250 [bacterium CG2_30_54_10]
MLKSIPSVAHRRSEIWVGRSLAVLFIIGSLFASKPSFAQANPGTADNSGLSAMYVLKVARLGDFLKTTDSEPLELLRRIGRIISEQGELFENEILSMAGFYSESFSISQPLKERFFGRDWTQGQKVAAEKLMSEAGPILDSLEAGLPPANAGLTFKGVFDPKGLVEPIAKMLESEKTTRGLSVGNLFKLKTKVLPVLQIADLIAFIGALTRDAFQLHVQMKGGKLYKANLEEMGGPPETLTATKYIASDCLLVFAQVHFADNPASLMANLREIPQTKIVESYLASAGLDFEKDILANPARETLVMVNLNPRGEAGLPDVRAIARVRDAVKLLALLPKLKQLAVSVGVFVSPTLEAPPSIRLSHFLLPNYGIHVAMRGDLLLMTSARELMVELSKRMDEIDGGKAPALAAPTGIHRYWRISFGRMNEQIQRFLQSPILAGKGIPPISNMTIANELGDFVLETRILPDNIDIRVNLPIRGK